MYENMSPIWRKKGPNGKWLSTHDMKVCWEENWLETKASPPPLLLHFPFSSSKYKFKFCYDILSRPSCWTGINWHRNKKLLFAKMTLTLAWTTKRSLVAVLWCKFVLHFTRQILPIFPFIAHRQTVFESVALLMFSIYFSYFQIFHSFIAFQLK